MINMRNSNLEEIKSQFRRPRIRRKDTIKFVSHRSMVRYAYVDNIHLIHLCADFVNTLVNLLLL